MFFAEYSLTPHVFEKSYHERNTSVQRDLIYFLRGLKKSGLLGNINNEIWQQEVIKYLKTLPPMARDKLSYLLQELKKSNRLVTHEDSTKESLSDEYTWLKLMLEEDAIKPYSALVYTGNIKKPNEKTTILSDLIDSDEWNKSTGDYMFTHTRDNLKLHLRDFLMYAKKLTISDSYFTYNYNDVEALYIYADLFAKRRSLRMKNRKIIIHTSYNERDYNVDIKSDSYKIKWSQVFKNIYNEYGHIVTLHVWKDTNRVKKMHDRFMITDQGGLHSGRGFGIMPAKSIWTLLNSNVMRSCLNIHEENFDHNMKRMFSITKDSIVKKEYLWKI